MRDAFGGVFMIRIFLIFIIIYVAFTAIVLNYAKAFKAKDLVIKYLEANEVFDATNLSHGELSKLETYIETNVVDTLHYAVEIECPAREDGGNEILCLDDYGILIEKLVPTDGKSNKMGVYYRVTTFFGYDIGFFDLIRSANSNRGIRSNTGIWKIKGETRAIVKE